MEVNSYTGQVQAKISGTAVVQVSTVDGNHCDTIAITVVIDTVTIEKDGDNYTKVIFNSTGKVWCCINRDMIYEDTYQNNSILIDRTEHGYYVSEDPLINNQNVKTYPDDEIRLLYAIDTYGVAYHVKQYAKSLESSDSVAGRLEQSLQYKDSIFELLCGRKPKYFVRNAYNEWQETDYRDNLYWVMSESETLFGAHVLYDAMTIQELVHCCLSIVNLVLEHYFLRAVRSIRW